MGGNFKILKMADNDNFETDPDVEIHNEFVLLVRTGLTLSDYKKFVMLDNECFFVVVL